MRLKRKLLIALIAVVAIGVVALLIFSAGPVRFPALPSPNGYDDFLAAGDALMWKVEDFSNLNQNDLHELIATNAEPLRLLRLGLTRRCSIPTEKTIANFGKATTELINLKRLAQLLAADGRLAEMENRPGDAAKSYVDAIQFGNEISHGGFIIYRMVGIACEGIGVFRLVKVMPGLNCQEIRPLITALERIENNRVTWEEVKSNERRFARSQLRRYTNPFIKIKALWEAWRINKSTEMIHNKATARTRLLIIDLGLRCYRADKGQAPLSLKELAPEYFRNAPLDPFTAKPFIYRQQGTNWMLYSVGPDRTDDAGKAITSGSSGRGDFFVESR
jgi:hypothetical protein